MTYKGAITQLYEIRDNELMPAFLKPCFDKVIETLTSDVRDDVTAHKVVGGGERDGATCWFECDNCGLAVDIGDVFCKHCGARFVP